MSAGGASSVSVSCKFLSKPAEGEGQQSSADLLVSVLAEDSGRTPCEVCAVIDVSGSMSSAAKVVDANGNSEDEGLSLLDVVKHAVKTVIATLGRNDALSIVAFASTASVVLPLTPMNEKGKKKALHKLDTLYPTSATNLWGGLQLGMESLAPKGEGHTGFHRPRHVLLLTDGCPNVEPPRGHIPTLVRFRDKQPGGIIPTLHTFGFGYSLDSELLEAIAKEGGGLYSFIPDAGFVGTAFVNALSNVLVTAAEDAELSIEVDGGFSLLDGGFALSDKEALESVGWQIMDWGLRVPLGNLQQGQSRDVVLSMSSPSANVADIIQDNVVVSLKYRPLLGGAGESARVVGELTPVSGDDAVRLEENRARQGTVVVIHKARTQAKRGGRASSWGENAQSSVAAHVQELCTLVDAHSGSELLKGLLKDVEGQVAEAVSKHAWYNRWGRHYLPSLARAHELQMCNNFKDPGVQKYGGNIFGSVRDFADDAFSKLPAPKPSRARPVRYSAAGHAMPSAPIRMSRYNCSSVPCFEGSGSVLCADGSSKRVDEVAAKDMLRTGELGVDAEVVCVVRTLCAGGRAELTQLPGSDLLVTPWHPVRDAKNNNAWTFPCEMDGAKTETQTCPAVYSFLLRRSSSTERKNLWASSMVINGVHCATLAHGLEGSVIGHDFFGTEAVVRELRKSATWNSGLVTSVGVQRNVDSGLVCGFRLQSRSLLEEEAEEKSQL